MGKLEKQFAEINAKLQESAKALREATDLADQAGLSLVENIYGDDDGNDDPQPLLDTYVLIKAIDHAGWMTSSMSC
jgi:hypothetical protein